MYITQVLLDIALVLGNLYNIAIIDMRLKLDSLDYIFVAGGGEKDSDWGALSL